MQFGLTRDKVSILSLSLCGPIADQQCMAFFFSLLCWLSAFSSRKHCRCFLAKGKDAHEDTTSWRLS